MDPTLAAHLGAVGVALLCLTALAAHHVHVLREHRQERDALVERLVILIREVAAESRADAEVLRDLRGALLELLGEDTNE